MWNTLIIAIVIIMTFHSIMMIIIATSTIVTLTSMSISIRIRYCKTITTGNYRHRYDWRFFDRDTLVRLVLFASCCR